MNFFRNPTTQAAVINPGKVLGGSSSINSMAFVRGSKEDFNRWEKRFGATGWNYSGVLPHFKAIETFNVSGVPEHVKSYYHGMRGETPINYPRYQTPLSYHFLNACSESHYEYVDYNGDRFSGYSRVQSNTAAGVRMSANKCFLKSVRNIRQGHLHVSTKSIVTQLVNVAYEETPPRAASPPASQPYQALSNQNMSVQAKKVVHNVYAQVRKSDLRW
ncbi:hypothetical protein HPB50_019534 [Hyalomma asiaticum]|uniref:Uncharacterized protein n=1 Tax=Hyalomma asiaticum TaxID=266040 RepID=A0ACB7TBD5_HYAAI|nr:hypothetical protein HPB50_019534 [Hyalomma asiaticum]